MKVLRDIMVRSPVEAEPWQPVGFVRQIMLTNSFSYLPIFRSQTGWCLVSDAQIAAMLRSVKGDRRRQLLATTLEDSTLERHGFEFEDVTIKSPNEKIESIVRALLERSIVLVVDADKDSEPKKCDKLVGIVTAFDIL